MKNFLILTAFIVSASASAQQTRHTATHRAPATGTSVTRVTSDYSEPSATAPMVLFKVGAGFASISQSMPAGAAANNTGSTMGMNFGATIDMPVSPNFSINTGLNYIQKGFSTSDAATTDAGVAGKYETTSKVSYLEIPILAKANFGQTNNMRFNIAAGPYAAFKIASSSSASFSAPNVPSQDIPNGGPSMEGISSLDFGIKAGAGAEFPMAQKLSFLVGAEYDFGLKNVAAEGAADTKTRTLIANIGLGMKI